MRNTMSLFVQGNIIFHNSIIVCKVPCILFLSWFLSGWVWKLWSWAVLCRGWSDWSVVSLCENIPPPSVYSPQVWRYKKHHFTSFLCHFRPWESKKLPLCWEYFFRLHKKRKWKHNICTAKLGRLSGLEKNYWIWELLTYFILHRVNQPDKNKWIKCGLYFREAEYVISRISCNPPISL